MLDVLEINAGKKGEMVGHIQRRNNDYVSKGMLGLEQSGKKVTG